MCVGFIVWEPAVPPLPLCLFLSMFCITALFTDYVLFPVIILTTGASRTHSLHAYAMNPGMNLIPSATMNGFLHRLPFPMSLHENAGASSSIATQRIVPHLHV